MKGRRIVIPFSLKKQTLQHLHSKHIGIGKTRPIAYGSVNQINKTTDIKSSVEQCAMYTEYQQMWQNEEVI